MWMGVAVILIAAILNEVLSFVTYSYTQKTVRQQTAARTKQDLNELQRITNLKARVESAVQATVSIVEENLENRQEMYRICAMLVDRNKHIIGSAVALRPGFYHKADSAFAAFAYQTKDNGPVSTKQLPYDYETWEWYERPMAKDSIWWSEPYRDTGGSDMLIYTFSAPIHNRHKECVGVLTGDINYNEMVFKTSVDDELFNRLHLWTMLSGLVSIVLIVFIVLRSAYSIRKVNKTGCVVCAVNFTNLFRRRGSVRAGQRYSDFHSGVIRSDDRRKDRGKIKAAYGSHFRQVLMGLPQTVLPGSVKENRTVFRFISCNHFFSAAGITGERKAGKPDIRFQQSGLYQRCHQRYETAGVATGVGNTAGEDDLLPLIPEFRKSVGPVFRSAVRRACVDDDSVRSGHKGNRFPRRIIRQA